MNKKDQETLLQTIRARLERVENGRIAWMADNDGPWNIINPEARTKGGLVNYFKPSFCTGYDEYGNPINPEQTPIQ